VTEVDDARVDGARMGRPGSRSYFYLSYAHSPPLEGDFPADPDENVREFFGDLTAAVRRHAPPDSGLIPGCYDQSIPPGSDWKASLSRAIGAAEVFVPLYSPSYVARSWPGREWACFYQRVLDGRGNPEQRIAPVIWAPLWDQPELPCLDAALAVGAAESEYEKSGLRALMRITSYRNSYDNVVDQLAERVVSVAKHYPLPPSKVPDIDKATSPFQPEAPLAVFALAVAAPTRSSAPLDENPACYGDRRTDWRPFPGQELSLAEYARLVARRLDVGVNFTSLRKSCDAAAGKPGIVLIDPWFIAGHDGRAALRSALDTMPRWVLPLLVRASPSGTRASQLAEQVRAMLNQAGAPADSSRRARDSVSSLEEFNDVLPVLVAEAERRYLRHGGYVPLTRGRRRPRLGDTAQQETPSSAPHTAGETPDA
jgi:FxsC-like protein